MAGEKCRSRGFSVRKPPPRGQRSKSECAALTSSFERNNNDGKASLKQQKIAGNYDGHIGCE